FQKARIHFSPVERRASDNNLVRPPAGNFLRAEDASNAAADAHLHPEISSCFRAKVANEIIICALAHGSIQINHMSPEMFLELFQLSKDIRNSQLALPPVHQLDGLPTLQIDAGNQHERRTSTPLEARNCFSA